MTPAGVGVVRIIMEMSRITFVVTMIRATGLCL